MQTCSRYVCWPAGHITQDAVIEEDVLLAIGVDLQGGDAGGVVVHHHDTGAVEPLGLVHEQVAPLIVHVICNDKALWKVEIRFELIYTINARESWGFFFCNLKPQNMISSSFPTWKRHIHVSMKHLDQLGCLRPWSCTHVQDLHRNSF